MSLELAHFLSLGSPCPFVKVLAYAGCLFMVSLAAYIF